MDGLNEFKDLVRRMRNAQKKFFRMRTSENLSAAKKLERMVDDIIYENNKPLSLFMKEELEHGTDDSRMGNQ